MTISSDTSTIYDVAKAKLSTDIQSEHAKITLLRFGGAGLLAAMLGAGIGIACFGYSYVLDGRSQARKMADAMVEALEKAQLTTAGSVKLAEGSSVGLAPGGQVTLAPDSVIRVDPSPVVKIVGTGTTDAPTTFRVPATQGSQVPEARVVTQYTIFRTVPFEKGHVVTGWKFDNSNQTSPTNQYCYYDEPANDKTHKRIDLGENKTMLDNLKPWDGIDLRTAFSNCNWFPGG